MGPVRRALALTTLLAGGCGSSSHAPAPPAAPHGAMSLSSPEFADGATLPARFTCAGAGADPQLRWSRVPREARELALVVFDPDAPGGGFTHWTHYGIGPRSSSLAGGLGRDGRNSAGGVGWTPPCPPRGDPPHRYLFTLYALRRRTGLALAAPPATVIAGIRRAGPLAEARLTARFARR